MKAPASILFGAAFTVFSMWACGRLLLSRLKLSLNRDEENLIAFVCGGAVLSLLVFLLGAVHLLYDPGFLVLGLSVIGTAWRMGALRSDAQPSEPLSKPQRAFFLVVFVPFAVVTFLHAMAPEWSPDGSSYHLGVIGFYYRAHVFVPVLSSMYAHLSQGAEMLYLMAYAFGRHSAAALVHWTFGVVLALLVLAWGRRQGRNWAGIAGALFVYCTPVVMVDAASAYNDVAVACTLFALFLLCEAGAGAKGALLLGMIAGYCYGLKYTAFLAAPYALVRLWAQMRRERAPVLRTTAVFSLGAALMVTPWIAKNLWFTGNPVAPFFNHWFPNPAMHRSFEVEFAESMRNYVGLESYRALPLELTVRGHVLGGFLGPLFLLAPLGLLSLRKPEGRRLLAAGLLFALPYAANVGTRFLIPALPFVSLAMAVALPRMMLPLFVVAHGVFSFPDLPGKLYVHEYAWRIARIPFAQALRLESEHSYLARKFPGYKVARMVEQATPKGAVIYSFSPLPDSYTTREVWTSYQSAEGELLRDCFLMQFITDFPPVELRTFSIPSAEYDAIRAVQTAPKGPTDQWTMHEMHLLSKGQRLPRRGFRIRAWPNGREVGYIFDNAPMPRWRSWQWIEPGMFVEVKLDRPASVDEVQLEVSVDQRAARTVIEGKRAGQAEWSLLSAEPRILGLPVPLSMRRMAVEELKKRGISYLLVQPGDYMESDFSENAGLYGMTQIAERDGARLFRLN